MNPKQACIVGIGETEYTKRGGIMDRSELQLAGEAIMLAAQDAGINVQEIDGLCSFADDRNNGPLLQGMLGLPKLGWQTMNWGHGGAGAISPFLHAKCAVESGEADYVVVLRSVCQGQFGRYGQHEPGRRSDNFWGPFGLYSPGASLALVVQRYMHEYSLTREQMGEVALVCRENASRNPRSIMGRRPLTMAEYKASRVISDPFLLNDCCQESDGACALIVTTVERAHDLRQKPVRILAAAQANEPGWGVGGHAPHYMPADTYGRATGASCAAQLYRKAGVTPADIDTAQIYDHFTGMVILTLENFGFCGIGEGGAFVGDGNIRHGGALPINTAGGNLSEAYLQINNAVEAVRQVRGTSTSQVEDCELALVTGGSGALMSAAIFGA